MDVGSFLATAAWLGFITVSMPTIFSNFKSKTGGGISGALLVMWCVGDLMNLVVIARAASRFIVNVEFPQGALIKQPGLSQLGLSFFFLGSDLVLFLQHLVFDLGFSLPTIVVGLAGWAGFGYVSFVQVTAWRAAGVAPYALVGDTLPWISMSLFLLARFPQLWMVQKRRSVEGMALSMFAISIAANLLNFAALRVNAPDTSTVWQVNSGASFALDCLVVAQYMYFKKPSSDKKKKK